MNFFNDPWDYEILDAILLRMEELPDGAETTTGILFNDVAPGWEPTDADLSSIDAEIRRQAKRRNIALITPVQYRVGVMRKAYEMPFKIVKCKENKGERK